MLPLRKRLVDKRYSALFPDLAEIKLSHSWSGYCAGTFDMWPHLGEHEGILYALGYCYAGVPMGTYLGRKAALRIMGSHDAETVFSNRPFPTKTFYRGGGWFMPAVMKFYDWQDRRSR